MTARFSCACDGKCAVTDRAYSLASAFVGQTESLPNVRVIRPFAAKRLIVIGAWTRRYSLYACLDGNDADRASGAGAGCRAADNRVSEGQCQAGPAGGRVGTLQ